MPCPRGSGVPAVTSTQLDDLRARIEPFLEATEEILAVLPGDGATMVATTQKVLIVRDRAVHRPRSGLRSWEYVAIRGVAVQQPRNGQGRIALRTGRYPWQAVSMFFGIRHGAAAAILVENIRGRIAQAQRGLGRRARG
jgi:hypothetical protein